MFLSLSTIHPLPCNLGKFRDDGLMALASHIQNTISPFQMIHLLLRQPSLYHHIKCIFSWFGQGERDVDLMV